MEEAILVPSPNWFDVSILRAAPDGWVVYGGPNKSLVVLEPLSPECEGVIDGDHRYKAYVIPRAHKEKISCVTISPEWPEKRHIITGSTDGIVKQWSITKDEQGSCTIKNIHSHETHANEKEEVVGVDYSTPTHAVTIGSFSVITKWELTTNLVKSFPHFMKSFKALCMSCSPHLPLQVAVGTKQGVLFVLDLNGGGNVLYKVRGQDDEITQVSWCPQYEVLVKRTLEEARKKSFLTERLEKIRNEREPDLETSGLGKTLPDDSFDDNVVVPEDDMFDIYKDHEAEEFGHKKYVPEDIVVKKKAESSSDDFLAACEKLKADILSRKEKDVQSMQSLVDAMEKTNVGSNTEVSETSGDSKPAETAASGSEVIDASSHIHKHLLASIGKNGSVRIWSKSGKMVGSCSIHSHSKVKSKQPQYCSLCWYKPDCLLLTDGKTQLLQCNPLKIDSKNKLSWQTLHSEHKRGVYCIQTDAPRVQNAPKTEDVTIQQGDSITTQENIINALENSTTAQGNSTTAQDNSTTAEENSTTAQENSTTAEENSTTAEENSTTTQDNSTNTQTDCSTAKPESTTSQVNCTTAQTESTNDWCVWTAAQDRYLVKYSVEKKKVLAKLSSCGGYLYEIKVCPYDAGKIAVSVGDGAVRVWSTEPAADERKLTAGVVASYWQHVQGKVLACAWHPTRENVLAFSTAESRVGIIDTGSRGTEKPAKVLQPGGTGAVYSLCWGRDMTLLAGAGALLMYQANKPDLAPVEVPVEVEGERWKISSVGAWGGGLVVGSDAGGVAALDRAGHIVAAKFVYTKMIHMMDWHPQQTSSSEQDSQYKDLLAVCAMDKEFNIAILQLCDKEGGGKQFKSFTTLSGHSGLVHQVYWSPHAEGRLLSTSRDTTVRIWDAISGCCISIYGGHSGGVIGASWLPAPGLASSLLSGGSDCCLRLWDLTHYPASHYQEVKYEKKPRKKNTKKPKKEAVEEPKQSENELEPDDDDIENVAGSVVKIKSCKKFLLPQLSRQLHNNNMGGIRTMIHNYIEKNNSITSVHELMQEAAPAGCDAGFLKIFGTINDINEILDKEGEYLLEWNNYESYIMLLLFRGRMDTALQFAAARDCVDTFLLSVMPGVSVKFWKDAVQLYIAQMDRLAAKGEDDKLAENKSYGGVTFRKVAMWLATHDVMAALRELTAASMYKEAYLLCRIRHMDSVATDTLWKWATNVVFSGNLTLSAVVYLALGEVAKAATTLRKSKQKECLSLAAELARVAGLSTFADFMETKAAEKNDPTEQLLQELPSKIELLMKEQVQIETEVKVNGDSKESVLPSQD